MKRFKAPKKTLANLEPDTVSSVITAATDVALVVDASGVIRDSAFGSDDLASEVDEKWLGRPWTETVTVESRPKIEALLREAAADATPRGRQVNHPSPRGVDVPIVYSAVKISRAGRVVAVGRDLRPVAALQQRLVAAQQSIEQDYSRLRQAESRYRLLFQTATEGVLILDATSGKVLEANPVAARLLDDSGRALAGRAFPSGFDASGTRAVQALLGAIRTAGRADSVKARLAEGGQRVEVSASLLRQDGAAFVLVRLVPLEAGTAASEPSAEARLARVVDSAPDGFVVTSPDGRIQSANRAFLDLVQAATVEQVRGESLERWLGRPGVDLSVLMANLRQHGAVRLFATTLRGEFGATAEVEISAVATLSGDTPCLGFAIRNVERRLKPEGSVATRLLPRSVEQLTELIGHVSLKDLVREATDLIERLCIEAALELTGDNRASAAEMLGLSRQSLYVKLRRYGLGDLSTEESS